MLSSKLRSDLPFRIVNGIPDFLQSEAVPTAASGEEYDRSIAAMPPWRLRRIDEPLLQSVRGDVLEIGCGTCRLAPQVEKKGAVYFGLDPELGYLEHAFKTGRATRLVRARGEKMPFKDASFDCIISGYYAFRFVAPDAGLAQARRVLRPGGIFALSLLNNARLKLGELKRLVFKADVNGLAKFSFRSDQSVLEFTSLTDLRRRAAGAGFTVEKVFSTPLLPFMNVFNRHLSGLYLRGNLSVYLGYDVIIILKAI